MNKNKTFPAIYFQVKRTNYAINNLYNELSVL